MAFILFALLVFFAGCNKPDSSTSKTESQPNAFPVIENPPEPAKLGEDFKLTYDKLVQALQDSNLAALNALMEPNINCCESGVAACNKKFFDTGSADTKKEIKRKFLSLVRYGYTVRTQLEDTIAYVPGFLPPESGDSVFLPDQEPLYCQQGDCMYIPNETYQLYPTPEPNSKPEANPGQTYVQSEEKKNCMTIGEIKETDCEWNRVKTMSGKTGWIKRGTGERLLDLKIRFFKKDGGWKMTDMTTMGCATLEDMEGEPEGEP